MIHQMAPWVPTFIQSTKNNTQRFLPFQLATIDKKGQRPRCRTVVFRDFLFKDKRTNILTFNTDIRSGKIEESFGGDLSNTTPAEACFYFPETMEQYRFSGECFIVSEKHLNVLPELARRYGILSPSVCGHHKEDLYQYEAELDEEEEARQNDSRSVGNNKTQEDNTQTNRLLEPTDFQPPSTKEWNMEVRRQWHSISRTSRSQYRKPVPGKPITSETSKQLDKIQRGVDGTSENAGLDNFAVVCLCIEQVDYLNLKGGSGGERAIFSRVSDEHNINIECWDEEHVCP
ncbi:hypothetical protein HG537_0D04860 [Torulaspora globosa]|uniref:Pyridoxamine 5'-phosphate oxidase Alr4036 family FMN-binding domain-containing protein n=1 Tax=Torulaspora globosa TaxID=48254 RepID=A0A7H9HTS3_9SACH|nr:hypothetical protein HG537_0D04860 [Torulaspora sp. CBS 2947]